VELLSLPAGRHRSDQGAGTVDGMFRRTLGLIVATVMTAFALLLVHGQYVLEGRVVLVLSATRGWGVHIGDVLVAGVWLVALLALAGLVVTPPSARHPHDRTTAPHVRQPTL
jgi:hypothetical protein